MTREEAVKEIEKAFEPAFANYIIIALTEGATVSDIQHRWGRAYEAGVKDGLEQEPNTWSLDDAREDFMYDVYNTLDFLPTNEEANQIIDSFDRVTSSIKQEPFKPMVEIDLYSVIKQSYIEREVLDKIRSEIEDINLNEVATKYEDRFYGFQREVINILDKFKAESEDKE